MLRFLLSLIVLTLIITYLIIPLAKYARRFGRSEIKRIDNEFNSEKYNNRNEDV